MVVAAHEAAVLVTAQGVVVELTAASLTTAEDACSSRSWTLRAAPAPLPGVAVAPLGKVTLASGRTAFSGPVQLRLPYPDVEPDGRVDGLRPGAARDRPHGSGRFEPPRGAWVRLPRGAGGPGPPEPGGGETLETGPLWGVSGDRRQLGRAGTTGPSPPLPPSAPAQGRGWQDIGVVTTAPFSPLPWNATTLPDGDYELRVLCTTQLADLAAVQTAPAPTIAGDSASGGGRKLRPEGGEGAGNCPGAC